METESGEEYSLIWKGHIDHIKDSLINLLDSNELCDVTLYAEGFKIGVHKILLAACSKYFEDFFKEVKEEHPIIVLKEVEYEILLQILKFIYHGEVRIELPKLTAFLETAQFLQVSGLSKDNARKKTERNINVNETHQACNTEKSREEPVAKEPSVECQLSKLYKFDKNYAKDQKSNNSSTFDDERYSIESPLRTGESTLDYENIGEVSIENSPNCKRKRFKFRGRSSLNDINAIGKEEFELSKMETKRTTDHSLGKVMLKTSSTSRLDNSYKCNICKALFLKKDSLKKHFDVHLDPSKMETEQIPDHLLEKDLPRAMLKTSLAGRVGNGYKCNICNAVYIKKESLRNHFDVHLGNTKCNICGLTLSRRSHIARHIKIVHRKNEGY